jgi:hypothetical protein
MTLERLERVPKVRWKLKEVPLHLDRAVWIEDKHSNTISIIRFDARYTKDRDTTPPTTPE